MEGRESTVSGSSLNTESESPKSGVASVSQGVSVSVSQSVAPLPQVMNLGVSMSMSMDTPHHLASGGMGMEIGSGGMEISPSGMEMLAKKKRGRPRKYSPDGSLASPPSPLFSSALIDFSAKRGRGRPPGSGNRQLLASLGEWVLNSAGGNFTPHVVFINTGEDVAAKILSFSQKGPRAICILSANGAVSNVTIRQPGSSGGILTYEGRFEILALTGSFTLTDTGGARSRTGALSVSLAGPDGRVIGGGVAGLLEAASPIQVVVGSFMPNSHKAYKRKHNVQPSMPNAVPNPTDVVTEAKPISQITPDEDNCETPTSTFPEQRQGDVENTNNQNANSISFQNVGWHGSQSTSDHRPSPDINVRVHGE